MGLGVVAVGKARHVHIARQHVAVVEVVLFASVFMAGFVFGIARTVRDDRYQSIAHIISVGVCSGGLAFGSIAFLYAAFGSDGNFDWGLLGLATLIGLLGKELEGKVAAAVSAFLSKIITVKADKDA